MIKSQFGIFFSVFAVRNLALFPHAASAPKLVEGVGRVFEPQTNLTSIMLLMQAHCRSTPPA